jgi:hypothetical protein
MLASALRLTVGPHPMQDRPADQSATDLSEACRAETGLMGAAHPNPRRSPRQAPRGTQQRQDGKQKTNKTLRNPQSFSYEVSQPPGPRQHQQAFRAEL